MCIRGQLYVYQGSSICVLGVKYMCIWGQVYVNLGSSICVLRVKYMCIRGQIYVYLGLNIYVLGVKYMCIWGQVYVYQGSSMCIWEVSPLFLRFVDWVLNCSDYVVFFCILLFNIHDPLSVPLISIKLILIWIKTMSNNFIEQPGIFLFFNFAEDTFMAHFRSPYCRIVIVKVS